MITVIGHHRGLGKPLRLIVNRSWPDRIDVAPVAFLLRMLLRIAITFRRRGDQEFSLVSPGEVEAIESADRSDTQGFDAVLHVVDRACGRSEVEDAVDRSHIEPFSDVLLHETEPGFVTEMREVGETSGDQVIDPDDVVAGCK